MQYEAFNQGQCTILQIKEDRFDAKLAPSFRAVIEEKVNEIDTQLVLDLTDVRFMDSSGLVPLWVRTNYLREKKSA
ncbi:STAS domain-containing protein [Photobacterium sanguinicancri]|uniref:STAS domain-containing protein n=1 Tax=Photobacterium sanguinicancri TaxID=875932 RepID=UPI001F149D84|nr:STAS domain-containing protein [Photobacterium sanguinicancri]